MFLKELLKQATILLVDWTIPHIEQVPNLKILQLSIAGFDRIVKQPLYTDTKITFCTSNGIYRYCSSSCLSLYLTELVPKSRSTSS